MSAAESANPGVDARARPAFSYLHTVGFEETNVVGNVYFARHVAWQGRCREMFLKEHAPSIIDELAAGLRLITLKTSCEYFEEIRALETIEVRMRLAYLRQNRIGLDFEYLRAAAVVAAGSQEICCMRVVGKGVRSIELPIELRVALNGYRVASEAPARSA